jgi:hypothetical protein
MSKPCLMVQSVGKWVTDHAQGVYVTTTVLGILLVLACSGEY